MNCHLQLESITKSQCRQRELLDILCNTQRDKLIFDTGHMLNRMNYKDMTKKLVLQFTASTFDLIGILSPDLMPLKAIF